MNENTEKRVIAFTSQLLKQYGIRAVRMDTIARHMNVSKRTLYSVYKSKDNFIHACLKSYADRTQNLFRIIRYNHPEPLPYLCALSKAFIDNLYKAGCAFWDDISQNHLHIYTAIQDLWTEELEKSILDCQASHWVTEKLDTKTFLQPFTTLLYHARVMGCTPQMLHNSAHFMLRGIMPPQGLLQDSLSL